MNTFFSKRAGGARYSFDKVISYDTSSLVEGLGETDQRTKASVRLKHQLNRPSTSKTHQQQVSSMNDKFNQKLISHGTEKGVPTEELPEPIISPSVSASYRLGSYSRRR